ncbi:MAG: molybdopterin molybdotransferase MoeA [Theionarchaea archaeon]|nr:molybdopterin molybdotransferase MoeA [Theionarchaea archaeon]
MIPLTYRMEDVTFFQVTRIEDAQELLKNGIPQRKEEVPLIEAYNRVLAEDISSPVSIPPFHKALMDGAAVRSEDVQSASEATPSRLHCIEHIYAGVAPQKEVTTGTCSMIATGAPLPHGADAVVMIEYIDQDSEHVFIKKAVYPGENVIHKGNDVKQRDILFKKGTLLSPGTIGIIAGTGIRSAPVISRPRVAILSTGEELIDTGHLGPAKIYDVNSYLLFSLCQKMGAAPHRLGIVKDDVESLRTALVKALDHDLILLTAGVSKGSKDLVKSVCEDMGTILFHGLALKPGKPTLAADLGPLVLGLPGNPYSCFVTFLLLVAPLFSQVYGTQFHIPRVSLPLGEKIFSPKGRHHFVPVMISDKAYPMYEESGSLKVLNAQGLVEVPVNVEYIEKDEQVQVLLMENLL